MMRFTNSPLTLMMEIMNDHEQPWERKMDAAHKAFPYLHRKLEDQHGASSSQVGNGSGAGTGGGNAQHGIRGPTINLHVNRPSAPSVVVNQQVAPAPVEEAQAPKVEPAKEQEQKPAQPKVFKRKKASK